MLLLLLLLLRCREKAELLFELSVELDFEATCRLWWAKGKGSNVAGLRRRCSATGEVSIEICGRAASCVVAVV